MMETRTCGLRGCPTTFTTADRRKFYCTKKHADRSRNLVEPAVKVYTTTTPPQNSQWDEIRELRHFSRLTDSGKAKLLNGQSGFSIVGFDIEATHLKPNVGRILCASFKELGEPVYTFHALERRFKRADVYDDSALAMAIRDELEKYDIIVGWNSKDFDTRFVNARCIRAGHRTKRSQYQVDGMWAWRSKFNAWSGLDSAQKFTDPEAVYTKTAIAWEKWMQALGWDKAKREEAMAEITHHCELDVAVLEEVYTLMAGANVIRSLRKDGGVM